MSSAPQANDSGTKRQPRYLAADFQRLTHRRRFTSPHIPSPDFKLAQEPRHAAQHTRITDRRAIDSRPSTVLPPASDRSRQSSTSSSSKSGDAANSSFLKQCVAEDDHGVSHFPFPPAVSSRVHSLLHKFYIKQKELTVGIMRVGIAQSFLESVNASISEPGRDATSPTSPTTSTTSSVSGETCECCCRCGRSPKWQPLGRGKKRSKSYTALRTGISELSGWDSDITKPQQPQPIVIKQEFGPGEAPLERLPVEVLGKLICRGRCPRNASLTLHRRHHCPTRSRPPTV